MHKVRLESKVRNGWGRGLVVEHLLSLHVVLDSILRITKEEKI